MREATQHILFIATEYASGMRPYAHTIINTMWQPSDHVVVVAKSDSVRHDYDSLPADSVSWIDYPANKVKKAIFRFHPRQLIDTINRIINEKRIRLIYSLTGELVLAGRIKRWHRRVPVLYTVHDAVHHESDYDGLVSRMKEYWIVERPQRSLLESTPLKITNSQEQQRYLQSSRPQDTILYAPFPTLVTQDIMSGMAHVPELSQVDDGYILFFGNLQLYKGVHLLYETYLSHPELQTRPLVIAGSGYIYYKRRDKEKGVIHINRYIHDRELRQLFSRAAVVVYPYTSATQSGVASIASYFGKPMVLSDLPYFKETCEGAPGVEFFESGNTQSLVMAIKRALQATATTHELYERVYAPQTMRDALDGIFFRIWSSTSTLNGRTMSDETK